MRCTIHVCSRDRHSELALLIQSLRTQTFQDWDLVILDSASGTPVNNCQFIQTLLNELKMEGHGVRLYRQDFSSGVCSARNRIIELDDLGNPLTCRLDDDVILEPTYLEKLFRVIQSGYDIASGVTPPAGTPRMERETKHLEGKMNVLRLGEEGELLELGDDCGYTYTEEVILPADHFRSCAMYKSEINQKVRYPLNLSFVGFREEAFWCLKAKMEGWNKIGIHTGAVNIHLRTPSGGVRVPDYAERVATDEETFKKFLKQHAEVLT